MLRLDLSSAATAAGAMLGLALGLLGAAPAPAAEDAAIAYERFTLDNGLTVIVHTDRKAPVVAVNLWYHVGSKNERPGKTGFAHLFEHLMFQGSENFNDEFFKPFEQVGATNMNGTTNFDRTNYFQNVPTTALDLALWMESDRMGHLLGVVDQARLDEQRGVVQNEKRQGENRPYGRVWESLFRASFPAGHPYRWTPIGSMEDLNAATLEDVHSWFKQYYGAANATLVLAGDIDLATAREKAQLYFGDIAPGPALTRPGVWIAARDASTRETMYDQVAQSRLYRVWNGPPDGTPDADLLAIAARILGGGKTSRLYERLVYRERLADTVGASYTALEIAGLFGITSDVKNGVPSARVEAAIEDELHRFMDQGPTSAELEGARTAIRASFIKGLERIGGFGGKADVLAACEVYEGDPACYRRSLEVLRTATPEEVREAARRWLSQGDHTLEVLPYPTYRPAASSAVDRSSGVPVISEFPGVAFPEIERHRLSNGLPVVLAHRAGVGVLDVEQNLGVMVLAAHAERAPARRAAHAAEQLGEEIAEIGRLRAADAGTGKLEVGIPVGWRTEVLPRLVAAADCVVGGAFLGVGEDRIGLVDLLHARLGVRRLAQVRVELAGQLAKRLLDVLSGGVAGDAQRLVVVLELQSGLPHVASTATRCQINV